ncbi:MAG: prepilin peptidase [Pseudomonadota bacterium]
MLSLVVLYTLPALMLMAAASDIARYKIPNWISLALVAAFAVAAPFSGLGLGEIGQHIGVGFAALVVGFTLFQFGLVGGGDAKLFAAGALWFGMQGFGVYALAMGAAGGALCLLIMIYRAAPLPVASIGWLRALHDKSNGIPYGAAIAFGAVAALPHTEWMAIAFAS